MHNWTVVIHCMGYYQSPIITCSTVYILMCTPAMIPALSLVHENLYVEDIYFFNNNGTIRFGGYSLWYAYYFRGQSCKINEAAILKIKIISHILQSLKKYPHQSLLHPSLNILLSMQYIKYMIYTDILKLYHSKLCHKHDTWSCFIVYYFFMWHFINVNWYNDKLHNPYTCICHL